MRGCRSQCCRQLYRHLSGCSRPPVRLCSSLSILALINYVFCNILFYLVYFYFNLLFTLFRCFPSLKYAYVCPQTPHAHSSSLVSTTEGEKYFLKIIQKSIFWIAFTIKTSNNNHFILDIFRRLLYIIEQTLFVSVCTVGYIINNTQQNIS